MPFYTFKCPSCNKEEEVLQNMNAPNPVCKSCVNASCGTHTPEMERVFKSTGRPQFKGDGFYETDYKGRMDGKMRDFKKLDDTSKKSSSRSKDMGIGGMKDMKVQYKPVGKNHPGRKGKISVGGRDNPYRKRK